MSLVTQCWSHEALWLPCPVLPSVHVSAVGHGMGKWGRN